MQVDKPFSAIEAEVAHLLSTESRQVDLKTMDGELRAIGYRLDRRMDCRSVNRHMSGARAGESYHAVNLYVVQVSDGVSAFHVDSRRDANFDRLQQMRLNQEIFAVQGDRIYGI
jgi:hypothetical protein